MKPLITKCAEPTLLFILTFVVGCGQYATYILDDTSDQELTDTTKNNSSSEATTGEGDCPLLSQSDYIAATSFGISYNNINPKVGADAAGVQDSSFENIVTSDGVTTLLNSGFVKIYTVENGNLIEPSRIFHYKLVVEGSTVEEKVISNVSYLDYKNCVSFLLSEDPPNYARNTGNTDKQSIDNEIPPPETTTTCTAFSKEDHQQATGFLVVQNNTAPKEESFVGIEDKSFEAIYDINGDLLWVNEGTAKVYQTINDQTNDVTYYAYYRLIINGTVVTEKLKSDIPPDEYSACANLLIQG